MMAGRLSKIIERGNVYFLYRPKIGKFAPEGPEDIQRFYMVLKPNRKKIFRLMVVAQKKLPSSESDSRKYWGYVERIDRSPQEVKKDFAGRVYATRTAGERGQPSGRPVGEGVYALVLHKDHAHLVYSLNLPKNLGQVQKELNIKKEGNYIVSVINPKVPPPDGFENLTKEQIATYPRQLQSLFGRRRFTTPVTADFLNYQGSALLLIAVNRDVSRELGIEVEPKEEDGQAAKVFKNLKLERAGYRTQPFFRGEWA
jgi:hypothetical protein